MDNIRKIAIFLALFTVLTAYSFGETLYSFSTGFYRFSEQYIEENYSRELDGVSLMIALNYFPEKFPLGWFIKTSIGGATGGFEWKDDTMDPLNLYSSSDIRLSVGPSIRLKMGSIIQVPISIGPVFTNYREENSYYHTYVYDYDDPHSYSSDSAFFEAFNLGALADVSIVINPFRRLTIVNGLTASYDFMRWERGYMQMNYRSLNSVNFKEQKFSALTIGFYIGIGVRFEASKDQKKD